jgi:hypothetical protein
MPYAEGRRYYDADSHLMETPEWLPSYAEPTFRDRIPGFSLGGTGPANFVEKMIARGRSRAGIPAERAAHEAELMTRKSWDAYGAFHAETVRARSTRSASTRSSCSRRSRRARPTARRTSTCRTRATRALTRGMLEFCAGDPRLLPVTYVPVDRARACDRGDALRARRRREGHHALADPAGDPLDHAPVAPSALRALRGARRPDPLPRRERSAAEDREGFGENGFTGQTDFHGGGENFTGLLYMAVSHWAEIALAALIFDQILEKFPRLMVGVIELGAVWVPAWLERLEIVKDTFGRTESRIRELPLRRRLRPPPDPRDAVPDRGRRPADRALRAGALHVSRPTSRTSKGGREPAEALRGIARRTKRGGEGRVLRGQLCAADGL